jgi:Family of unknown function (DUF6527)
MKIETISLELVELVPAELQPGVLYASKKYSTAAHLCACGCGEKVRTQLGYLGWQLTREQSGPTLYPSIGNWQKPCRSHYFIRSGRIIWLGDLTDAQILEGRSAENSRRDAHFAKKRSGWWARWKEWFGKNGEK